MYDWEIIRCKRCDAEVDPATAYKQSETIRMKGKAIKCTAHYCNDCARVLKMIGAGELSAMAERAVIVPSAEPETKPD